MQLTVDLQLALSLALQALSLNGKPFVIQHVDTIIWVYENVHCIHVGIFLLSFTGEPDLRGS